MSKPEDESAPTPKNALMSDVERRWLADNWHRVNDIGDAEEREEWRERTRLRSIGIDPNASELEILVELRKRLR
jgi:hypothetical protein